MERLALIALLAVGLTGPVLQGRAQAGPLGEHQLLMYTPASAEVSQLRRLYQAAGRVLPIAGFPVSAQTLAELAERLAAQRADETTAATVEQYLRELAHEPQALQLSVWGRLSLAGYLSTDTPAPDLRRDCLERLPLGDLTLAWARPEKAGILIEAFLRSEYDDGYAATNLPGSAPRSPVALENKQISRGYFWYDFAPLQLQFGRDKVHFGPLRSALLPSDSLPFLDMLRLTLPLGPLTMDLMICSLESRQAQGDWEESELKDGYGYRSSVILANLHRFEYDFGFLRAAVSGLCVYARPENAFVLADFFPVFSWHSADITPNNLSLIFDLEAVPVPGLRLMTQFGFDDINASAVGGDSDIPTIGALIAGLEYSGRLGRRAFSLYGEAGYTHYLWGNFDDDCYLGRAIYRLAMDNGTRLLPLTSPYGPGAVWAFVEASLQARPDLSGQLFVELVFRNRAANLGIPYEASDAIRDAPRQGSHRVGLKLRYRPRTWLQASVAPAVYFGSDEPRFELGLGLSALLDRRWNLKEPRRR